MTRVVVEASLENVAVFAGESLSAVITFRNTSGPEGRSKQSHGYTQSQGHNQATQPPKHQSHYRQLSMVMDSEIDKRSAGADLKRANTTKERDSIDFNNGGNSTQTTSRSSFSMGRPSLSSGRPSFVEADEGLLMGFAQIQGYFQVDNSLIDSEKFDPVRKHGVIVGKDGLLGYSNSSGGFLKGITSGIGNLLTPVREESATPSSNHDDNIPIFSTPQSLLFVDLKLAPGESKSYGYTIKLPNSLPPSCRAKSIKIYYNVVVGTQKLDYRGRPQPKMIHIPFRVFPYVDSMGHQPIHNLNEPIVLKTDDAVVTPLGNGSDVKTRKASIKTLIAMNKSPSAKQDASEYKKSEQEFFTYVDQLLSSETQPELLFPASMGSRQPSVVSQSGAAALADTTSSSSSCRQNIDYFVRYHNQLETDHNFKSKFDIGRGGHRIASVSLSKSLYRVGEDVIVMIDFTDSEIQCQHVSLSLETTEKITDKSIALTQDENSEQHASRRVYLQHSTCTFDSAKTHFEFTIPSTATPQFATSGIALHWGIRLEFITTKVDSTDSSLLTKHRNFQHHRRQSSTGSFTTAAKKNGVLALAKTQLECDSFECQIPLNVFPTNHDIGALIDITSRRYPI